MDWSPSSEAAESGAQQLQEATKQPAAAASAAVAELHELSSFSMLPSSLNSSGRRLGRKISHKKSASDTFAFAAGQHDFLALLAERPIEPAGHARHASSGAGLAGSPSPDADQQMAAGSEAPQQQAGSSLAHAAAPPAADTAAAAAIALGRTGPASASDPGTAAAAAAAAAAAGAGPPSSPAAAAAAAGAEETSPAAGAGGGTQTRSNALDTTQLDPRKAKRILANRQSAQRSRMKRLQYINELEGRRAKAEAGVRELRSKVDRAQRQHKTLAKEVEVMSAEASALQQQLLYEQGMQASLSSYVQSLQLQLHQQQQPQQHWGSGQLPNGYQMQQHVHVQQYNGTADMYQGPDGSYSYRTGVQQQYNGLMADPAGHVQQQQQQQQWAGYSAAGVHSTHQQQQHPGQQQQGYDYSQGYGYSQAAHLQQQGFAAGQHPQQPSTSTRHPRAAAATAAHRCSLSDASAASGPRAHAHTAGPASQQQKQHLHPLHDTMQAAGACVAAGATPFSGAAAAAAAAAAGGSHALAPQRTNAAGSALSPEGVSVNMVRGSVSQGSGSVLVHGSVSEAELDSLLGLGSGFGADSAGMEEPTGSPEAVVGLLAAGASGLLLPPDDLLVQEDGDSLLP